MAFERDEYHELCIWKTLFAKQATHTSSRLHMFFKINVLKNFTGKHLCCCLFLTLLKRDSNTGVC